MNLAIWGAGSLGKELLSLIRIENSEHRWQEIIFIDDKCQEEEICGIKVFKYIDFKSIYKKEEIRVIIASGEPKYRCELSMMLREMVFSLIHIFRKMLL